MTLRNSVVPVTAATLTGMTLNQVAFGNSTGGLQGSANLTFDGSTLTLTGAQSISGQLTSTVATGTAPFVVASTTQVANLNASQLIGGTWASPGAIGGTTANTGKFTSLTNTGLTSGRVVFSGTGGLESDDANFTYNSGTGALTLGNAGASHVISSTVDSADITTGSLKTLGGLAVTKALQVGTTITAGGTVRVNRSNSFDVTFASYYVGGNFSYYFTADGTMSWGPGTAGVDTTLTRIGVGSLQVGGALSATGSIKSTSATGGIGYTTGAGGTVTQATSKSTGVTLNTVCGTITLNGAALASATSVSFTLTNSAIAATDVVALVHDSVGTLGGYTFAVTPASGSATITVRNVTAGSLSEAIVLRFAVIKAVTA